MKPDKPAAVRRLAPDPSQSLDRPTPSFGLTTPETHAMLALSHHLPPFIAVVCLADPHDGQIAQIVREGLGVVAAVVRINGHLALLDYRRYLDGVAGQYETMGSVVNALRLSLANFGPGPRH